MKKNKKQRQRKQEARQRQRQRKRAPKDRSFNILALDKDDKIIGFIKGIEMARHTLDALGLKGKRVIINLKAGDEEKLSAILDMYHFIKYEDLFAVSTDADCIAYCMENFPGGHFQLGDIAHDDIDSPEFWKKSPFENIALTIDDIRFRYSFSWAREVLRRNREVADEYSRTFL